MKISKSIVAFAFSVAFLFCFIVTPATAGENDNNTPQIMQKMSLDKTQTLHENEMGEIRGEAHWTVVVAIHHAAAIGVDHAMATGAYLSGKYKKNSPYKGYSYSELLEASRKHPLSRSAHGVAAALSLWHMKATLAPI
jgi:hypothetical protein